MTKYVELFEPAFQRTEQLERSKITCGACWECAAQKRRTDRPWLGRECAFHAALYGSKHLKQEPVIAIHQGLVAETLGEEDGVALIDESGSSSKGTTRLGLLHSTADRLGSG